MRQASSPAPSALSSKAQRTWDDVCCRGRPTTLSVPVSLPRVHLSSATCSMPCHSPASDRRWPISPLACVSVLVSSHVCVCSRRVTVNGHHGLSYRFGSGRHSRHNQSNNLLCHAFITTGTLATREPHYLCTRYNKRPDGLTQVPWKRGRCLVWDTTCPDTLAQSYIQASSIQAESAEEKKTQTYSDIVSGVNFSPFAIETLEVF